MYKVSQTVGNRLSIYIACLCDILLSLRKGKENRLVSVVKFVLEGESYGHCDSTSIQRIVRCSDVR